MQKEWWERKQEDVVSGLFEMQISPYVIIHTITLAAQSTNHGLNEPQLIHANVSWHRKGGPRDVEVPGGCWLGGWTSANSAAVITTISTRLEPIPKVSAKIDV